MKARFRLGKLVATPGALNETEQDFIAQFRGDPNRHGVAIWLKSLQYLGYFPQHPDDVPAQVKSYLAQQLHLMGDPSEHYPWQTTSRDLHFARIRQYTTLK